MNMQSCAVVVLLLSICVAFSVSSAAASSPMCTDASDSSCREDAATAAQEAMAVAATTASQDEALRSSSTDGETGITMPEPTQGRKDYIDALAALYGSRNLTLAIELLHRSANGGESRAYWMLATFYGHGIGVMQSSAKAVLFHHIAALDGVPESHAALAYRYRHGIGTAQDMNKALLHSKAVADAVAASYNNDIVVQLKSTKLNELPYPKSNRAQRGFGFVSTLVGAAQTATSSHGGSSAPALRHGTAKSSEILQYHTYKAEMGHHQSAVFLAYAHMFGTHDVKQDGNKAMQYLRMAERVNAAAAYGAMGQLYLHGILHSDPPVLPDKKKAFELFTKGADLDDIVSINGLGYLYATGVPDVVQRDMTTAFRLFEKASSVGNAEATYNLGVLYLNGRGGVKQDIRKALGYFLRANTAGCPLAAWQLGNLHHQGVSGVVPANAALALQFYNTMMERGSWSRLTTTAFEAYEQGDYYTSFIDYALAAEVGTSAARWNLAYLLSEELVSVSEVSPTAPAELGTIQLGRLERAVSKTTDPLLPLNAEDARLAMILELLERSASVGDFEAHLQIGDAYFYGIGTAVDAVKAKEHYTIAANGGNSQARFNLGLYHQFQSHEAHERVDGDAPSSSASSSSLESDFHLAKRYYDQTLDANPHAYAAVKVALMSLNFQWWLHHFGSDGVGVDTWSYSNIMDSLLRGVQRWITGYFVSSSSRSSSSGINKSNWLLLGLHWDDLLLILCVGGLSVLLLLRNYIVHR